MTVTTTPEHLARLDETSQATTAAVLDDGTPLSPEATRRRQENLLLIRSAYRQPFGTFTGTLPGGLVLREAHGVMEWHDAIW